MYRTLSFAYRYLKGSIAAVALTKEDEAFLQQVNQRIEAAEQSLEACELKTALKQIMGIARMGNQYFQEHEPWKQKDTQKKTVYVCANLVAKLAILLEPYLPVTSEKMWNQLNLTEKRTWKLAEELPISETIIKKPEPLFTPLEDAVVEQMRRKFGGKKMELKELIPYQDFEKLDLRVGKIVEAEKHPNADTLVVLTVDIGEPVTVVAGIKQWYDPSDLVGKNVALLANLEPITLRGIQSKGMILAAKDEKGVSLLTVDRDVEAGSQVL